MQAAPQPYTLKPRLDDNASIGVVALATDATIEREWRHLLDLPGVGFYVSRILNDARIDPDTLHAMSRGMTNAMAGLVPDCELDCVVYACTSGSLFIGEGRVAELIRAVRPGVKVTNPLSAATAAFAALESRRVALLTPYIDEVNGPMARHFEAHGVEVAALGSFLNPRDPEVVRIDRESIRASCLALVESAPVDTIFVACTALAASPLVVEIERETGLMATTSNHAMAWHALRLCGVQEVLADRGRLFGMSL